VTSTTTPQRAIPTSPFSGPAQSVPWLRPLRLSRGLTQEQLAWRTGVVQSAIHYIERGRRAKTWTIRALAAALEVPPEALTASASILLETGLDEVVEAPPQQPWRGQR
jgi:transcriptional regulator with XRE-family HTH domain